MAEELFGEPVEKQELFGVPVEAPEPEPQTSALADIGRGVVAAPFSFVQGIAELGALGLDSAFDTDTSREVTDFFEGIKDAVGATPQRGAGKVTEELLSFGLGFVPIAGWLNRANLAAKGATVGKASSRFMTSADRFGKSAAGKKLLGNKAKLFGTTAAAAGVYETVVSTDGRSTMADSFSFLPDALRTEADTGLSGRDEAFRRMRNKLRQGAEASAMSLGFDAGLFGASRAVRGLGTVPGVSGATSTLARGVTQGFDLMGTGLSYLPGAGKVTDALKRGFSPTRGADPRIWNEIQDTITGTDAQKREAVRLLREYDKAANKAVKAMARNGTVIDKEVAKRDFHRFLMGNEGALAPYGEEVQTAANRLIELRVQLQDRMIGELERIKRSPTLGEGAVFGGMDESSILGVGRSRSDFAGEAIKEIRESMKSEQGYLNRLFEQYEDPVAFYTRFQKQDLLNSDLFKQAVREVRANMTKGSTVASEAQATEVVLDALGLTAVKKGVDPKTALDNLVSTVTETALGKKGNLFAKNSPLLKISDEMFIKRKPLVDQSPALRALMGEITDPDELFVTTIEKLSKTSASSDFFDRLAASGNTMNLSESMTALQNGGRPMVIRVPDPVTMTKEEYERALAGFAPGRAGRVDQAAEAEQVLRDMGYVKLGESDPTSVFGGRYGKLSGAYVAPEIEMSLTKPLQLNTGFVAQALAIANQVRGFSQKQLIIPNPASRVRDILGNTAMLMGNANLSREMDLPTMISLFVDDLSKLDEAGLSRLKRKLELSGTQDTNLLVSAIKDYVSEGPGVGAAAKVKRTAERAAETKLLKPFTKFSRFMENLAQGSDSFFKGMAVLAEEAKLTEALRASGVDPDNYTTLLGDMVDQGLGARLTSEALEGFTPQGVAPLSPVEVMAADIVKDTMPIYGRVGEVVRQLDRVPFFGNFTSFASENIRNSVNILDRGLKEMAYTVSPTVRQNMGEQAARTFERQIRALGAQRLASYLTVAAVAPKAMVRGSMMSNNVTPEQMQAMYEQLPEYMDGHDILVIDNDGEGNYKYVDLSYVAPYGFVTDSIQAGLRQYQEKGRLDKSEAEQIATGVFSSLSALLDPFASESIVFERVRDVLPEAGLASLGVGRGGQTSTGAKIYNETDSLGTKVSEGFLHVTDSLVPAYLKLGYTGRLGTLEPGRLTRAMTEVPGPRGQEYNSFEELARQVTGFTPMELNLKRDFEFSGLAYAPRRSEAKTAANRIIRAADSSPQDIVRGWDNYLNALYREQSKLYADILAARTLGLSDAEIRRNLIQKANLGRKEVNAIMRGGFYPGTTSREIRKEVFLQMSQEQRKRITDRVDWGALNRLSAERRGEALSPEMYLRRQRGEVETGGEELFGVPADENPFAVLGTPAAPTAAPPAPAIESVPVPAAPQPPRTPAGQPPAPMELLGADPISQARNAEIQRRLQQQ